MKVMAKPIAGVFYLFFTLFVFFAAAAGSAAQAPPHQLTTFKPRVLQKARSCGYTVIVKTSCSSTPYTRDQVSLAFGDARHNEVYVKRLDDPYSGTFERCSTDRFEIKGPCMSDSICYLYLLRRGSDGWKPESVKVYTASRVFNFNYNKFLPNGVWFGFNHCNHFSKSSS